MLAEIIGAGGLLLTLGAIWVQINSRISILEVQVKHDKEEYMKTDQKLDNLTSDISEVKNMLVSIQGDMKLKADKKFE